MSLALDFLKEYLSRPGQTQTDFAMSAGMTPTNVTDLLKGDVAVSDRNLAKLIRGFRTEKDRHDFLTGYLRDRVPADYADVITVHLRSPEGRPGLVMEDPAEDSLELQLTQAFAALPSDLYRRRVIRFLNHLKKDGSLRDLFTRTVAYLEEADTGSPLAFPELTPGPSPLEIAEQETARRIASPKVAERSPAPRPSSPHRQPTAPG